eukprot:scaffold72932_cov84-Cyclotella_meneghiniana.AAC.1
MAGAIRCNGGKHPTEASSVLEEVMRGSERVAERLSRLHEYKEEKTEVREEDKGEVKRLAKRLKVEWEGMPTDMKSYAQGKNISIKNEQGGDVRMQREWEVRRSWGGSVGKNNSRLAWMGDKPPPLIRDEPRQMGSAEEGDEEESWLSEWDQTDSEDESDSEGEEEGVQLGLLEGAADCTAPGDISTGVFGGEEGTTYGTVLGEDCPEEAVSADEGETDGATMRRPVQPLHEGLRPPELSTGERVSGHNKRQLRRENKRKRINKQLQQQQKSYWTSYKGEFDLPEELEEADVWLNQMCPQRLALRHPAAAKLLQYATGGCPCKTGKDWSKEEIWEAVERGPHVSALDPKAIEQLKGEIADKVKEGQCKVVLWDDVKHDPPKQMK